MSRINQGQRVARQIEGGPRPVSWANATRAPLIEAHARNRHRNSYLLGIAILLIGLIASTAN